MQPKSLIKKSFQIFFIGAITIAVIWAGASLFAKWQADQADTNVKSAYIEKFKWWNESYRFARQIEIDNSQDKQDLAKKAAVSFEIDHQTLVAQQKSRADANDIRLVYKNGDEFQEVAFSLKGIATNKLEITFALENQIGPLDNNNHYYIYYGNLDEAQSKSQPIINIIGVDTPDLIPDYAIKLGDELGYSFALKLSRTWILKGDTLPTKYNQAELTIDIVGKREDIPLEPKLMIDDTKFADIDWEEKNGADMVFNIKGADLTPGKHKLQIVASENYRSEILEFNVSYPLLMTWTIDWEGYDSTDVNLAAMTKLSSDHQIPMTQLFNPRIFVATDISKARQAKLVSWLLDRQNNHGDEIGLHLHMHFDMLKAAGITIRTSPNWGGRTNGHDVLTSDYTYDEFKKLLNWSFQQFTSRGLPMPKTYRAGGWFIGQQNIKALADTGFTVETSGREAYIWGVNKITGPWKLSSTTTPYQISSLDQNTNKEPLLNIWEFPNNGMDSTNNKADLLIKKFKDNYKQLPLAKPQVLTYLSHAHWLTTIDGKVMQTLLSETDKYRIDNDSGPVMYMTSQQAYEYWIANYKSL